MFSSSFFSSANSPIAHLRRAVLGNDPDCKQSIKLNVQEITSRRRWGECSNGILITHRLWLLPTSEQSIFNWVWIQYLENLMGIKLAFLCIVTIDQITYCRVDFSIKYSPSNYQVDAITWDLHNLNSEFRQCKNLRKTLFCPQELVFYPLKISSKNSFGNLLENLFW